jgi:glycosyltransferase involved in cell wall biosynthesis
MLRPKREAAEQQKEEEEEEKEERRKRKEPVEEGKNAPEDIDSEPPLVSVIVPVFNGEPFLAECLTGVERMAESAARSSLKPKVELCIFDDGSTDGTPEILDALEARLSGLDAPAAFVLRRGRRKPDEEGGGCGYAKNRAVRELSTGQFLCFQDADDISLAGRLEEQLAECRAFPNAIVGCGFVREPEDATPRYTRWANELSNDSLLLQRFRECTVIMPTSVIVPRALPFYLSCVCRR